MRNYVLIIVGFLFMFLVLSLAGWAWMYYTAELRGRVNAEVQLESAASRISRYEYFFDLCASVQRNKAALEAQRERLANVGDDRERSRVNSNIAGIRSQVAGSVARYNTDAAKDYTSARFLSSKLPYQLSIEGETRCVVQE